jgi:hypothetical protein
MGAFVGPLGGSALAEGLGFPRASAIIGLSMILFGIIYIFLGKALTMKKLDNKNEVK